MLEEFVRHESHVGIDMVEKDLVARAQIVKALFAIWGVDKPVLWAFTVAGKTHLAFPAIPRKSVALVQSELALLGGAGKRTQGVFHDVAQLVFRVNKMVA